MEATDALFSTPAMMDVWSGAARVRGMLAFEAALARAEARAGVIPTAAAEAIAAACGRDDFDVTAIFHEAAESGTPVIPLVRQLTARVAGEGRDYVHWGATSQDALDTALALAMGQAFDLLARDLMDVGESCARLADRHRRTVMVGRTLLQPAVPITFGLKAARWLALVTRQMRRLREVGERVAVVQLGGAAGTLAALGVAGQAVTAGLAEELGLGVPDLPWHAERDRVAEAAAVLGVLAGGMAKIATDLVLLAQGEVGEATDGTPGKGASSAMPQKRNPVDATLALAAARLAIGVVPVVLGAMAQEHERAAGAWQAEWEAVPAVFRHTAGAVAHVRASLRNLDVDAARMRANLDATNGAIMAETLALALSARIGSPEARAIVRELASSARARGTNLHEAARNDERVRAALSADAVDRAFDPTMYLGSNDWYIDRALADYRALHEDEAPSAEEMPNA
jgi:3-carboxy-cis,cis-muconate cycloisomerase